jgi:hypothetical protein
MVTFMKASGRTIKLMARELINMQMEQHTLANGKMTNNTAEELKLGLMALSMKDSMQRVRSMVKAPLHLQMVVYTRETSYIMKSQVKVDTYGRMENHMMVCGTKIKCMATVY